MLQAVLLDLGDTVLQEQSYDIETGFAAISQYLDPSQTIAALRRAISSKQIETSEFSVLDWIRRHLNHSDHEQSAEFIEQWFELG